MAPEPGAAALSGSPTDSGRATPVSRRWTNGRGEDDPLYKDKAFRRYASGVDRSLSLFDTSLQEWADYIQSLGRLLKSLQAHPPSVRIIPSKTIVAKRLAQCLNPTLPSGVHQKALEAYNYIFSMIGIEELSQNLFLYLPGLSSTLSFAALTVRDPFLALFETYIVKLPPSALRPALKAIILALLPGLEEETSEDFERTFHLVDGIKSATCAKADDGAKAMHTNGEEYFWQCFFLASITSNNRRLGALAYLTRKLPKLAGQPRRNSATRSIDTAFNQDSEVLEPFADVFTSPEPGLLLRCFATGLSDDQILVQRGFLDLLVTHLPLHAEVLQSRVKRDDLELLQTAACGVVFRRDMSLNRRLWAWLLGPEPSSNVSATSGVDSPTSPLGDALNADTVSKTRYFEEYGLSSLVRAILKLVQRDSLSPADRSKPSRMCLSLMDRWEIGGLVVPEIFLPIIKSVQRYERQAATNSDFTEVVRSVSVFFDGVESGLIWGELFGLIANALESNRTPQSEKLSNMALITFILSHFNVREEEMITIHAPTTALAILIMIQNFESSIKVTNGRESREIIGAATSIVLDILNLIPARAFVPRPIGSPSVLIQQQSWPAMTTVASNDQILEQISRFYTQEQGNLEGSFTPLLPELLHERLMLTAGQLTCRGIESSTSAIDAAVMSRILIVMILKGSSAKSFVADNLLQCMQISLSKPLQRSFSTFTSFVSLSTTLLTMSHISEDQFSGLVFPLVHLGWTFLTPSRPKYHVEAVRGLWQLQSSLSFSNHEIEAAICSIMTDNNAELRVRDEDVAQRFSILWTHTLQDNSAILDQRNSRVNGQPASSPQQSSTGNYGVMLGRPLFLLLDGLIDEKSQMFMTVKIWLQNLSGIDKIFRLLIVKLSGFGYLFPGSNYLSQDSTRREGPIFTEQDDIDQCVYYLQNLSSILRSASDSVWIALSQKTILDGASQEAMNVISERKLHNFDLDRADHVQAANSGNNTAQEFFVHICLDAVIGKPNSNEPHLNERVLRLHRIALTILHQILLSPYVAPMADIQIEDRLIAKLETSLNDPDPYIQVSLLTVIFATLKMREATPTEVPSSPKLDRRMSLQEPSQPQRVITSSDNTDRKKPSHTPSSMIRCFQAAFVSPNSRPVLDSWIWFLSEYLPFYADTIYQIIIPLVETFCKEIADTFDSLQATFKVSNINNISHDRSAPESSLISLLNGLERVLACGHEWMVKDESQISGPRSPELQQGFFGNMVSGVFASDAPQLKSSTANNRLTILLSFQDAVRICFTIWSWGGHGHDTKVQDPESVASFNSTSLRMRNRARRLLEHLFAAEALECLETVIEIWEKAIKNNNKSTSTLVFDLLHVLDGSKPKYTMPAIFDAIYSRTNPSALEAGRKSSLTSTLIDTDLVVFLVQYSKSLEDDAMDEIWTDCMSFLKDILANPFPHRQTLPALLEFTATLGEKADNTNFGEQKKLRRELADLFLRLLTATFTTKPLGFIESSQVMEEKNNVPDEHVSGRLSRSDDIVGILAAIVPKLPKVLVEPDRIFTAANAISSNLIGPTIRSKSFPENVTKSLLALIYHLARLPSASKIWKKDLMDAFNDPRLFSVPFGVLQSGWLPLIRHWTISDKERMGELLSRLSPPTTAGIVFGVGATSARHEADRKTQLNLRRITTLIMAAAEDNYVTDLNEIGLKIVELLSATSTSSPSSTTRGEIYMVIRALVLKMTPIHLAFIWPIVNAELHAALSSVIAPDHSQSSDTFNNFSILQACKLLDTLLCLAPDDFQLHEWLFITDTIDAVYRPSDCNPVGLVDQLSEELGATAIASTAYMEQITAAAGQDDQPTRRPLLGPGGIECDDIGLERKDELVGKVLRPFFGQLSIFAFERTYEMAVIDTEAWSNNLLRDVFQAERGLVKAL